VTAPQAHAILGELAAMPGVVGTMWCGATGDLLAHAFPAAYDPERLGDVAGTLAARTRALEAALGPVRTLDVRFAAHRTILRPVVGGGRLLFLCAPQVNPELLSMWASGAAASLARLGPPTPPPPGAPEPSPGGQLWEAVQRVQALIARSGQDPVVLRGRIALKAGFPLDLVERDAPDDPTRLQKLKAAAEAVLGQPI